LLDGPPQVSHYLAASRTSTNQSRRTPVSAMTPI
jgi:hypothetical protein